MTPPSGPARRRTLHPSTKGSRRIRQTRQHSGTAFLRGSPGNQDAPRPAVTILAVNSTPPRHGLRSPGRRQNPLDECASGAAAPSPPGSIGRELDQRRTRQARRHGIDRRPPQPTRATRSALRPIGRSSLCGERLTGSCRAPCSVWRWPTRRRSMQPDPHARVHAVPAAVSSRHAGVTGWRRRCPRLLACSAINSPPHAWPSRSSACGRRRAGAPRRIAARCVAWSRRAGRRTRAGGADRPCRPRAPFRPRPC